MSTCDKRQRGGRRTKGVWGRRYQHRWSWERKQPYKGNPQMWNLNQIGDKREEGPADMGRQQRSNEVRRGCRYLLKQARTLRDGHGSRGFPASSGCIFGHKPGHVATDRNTVLGSLNVTEDSATCRGFGGYGRSASQKDRDEQGDEGKQGNHGAVWPRESTLWVLRNGATGVTCTTAGSFYRCNLGAGSGVYWWAWKYGASE